jgi:hypothetical protein
MKTIAATILAALFGTSLLFAHQMEGSSTEGLFGLKAEYAHVLLNPLPVYGLLMGGLVLAAGLLARSNAAQNIGLVLIVLCAASAWPVLYYGQHGYNHLYPQLDPESQQWLNVHMERAERFIYAFYATAVLGIAALLMQKKFPRGAKVATLLTLLAAIVSLGIGAWISRAGGQASHSEFRGEEAPPPAPTHEHGAHDDTETSRNNGAHQHQHGASEKSSEETKVPDTIEGVWTEIHKHHGELASAVNDKKFSDVQSHATEISGLAKRLVEVAQPDRKSAIENGFTGINRLLNELKSSAETGSELVMKNSFKECEESLKQLEEQMKKQ